jgi:multiple sugar transport system ATP-binding protein
MDEPLSNLDAKLRVQMRAEIHKLQRALGVTTIYVTHDQVEAMTMGDRVAVMRSGHLQQVDAPERIYEQPANQFVAGFIGSPPMNMIAATLNRTDEGLVVSFGGHRIVVDPEIVRTRPALRGYEGSDVVLGIRPEDFEDAAFAQDSPGNQRISTICSVREALGSEVLVHFPVDVQEGGEPLVDAGSMFVARISPRTKAREGERLELVLDARRVHFFDPETGTALYDEAVARPVDAVALTAP